MKPTWYVSVATPTWQIRKLWYLPKVAVWSVVEPGFPPGGSGTCLCPGPGCLPFLVADLHLYPTFWETEDGLADSQTDASLGGPWGPPWSQQKAVPLWHSHGSCVGNPFFIPTPGGHLEPHWPGRRASQWGRDGRWRRVLEVVCGLHGRRRTTGLGAKLASFSAKRPLTLSLVAV